MIKKIRNDIERFCDLLIPEAFLEPIKNAILKEVSTKALEDMFDRSGLPISGGVSTLAIVEVATIPQGIIQLVKHVLPEEEIEILVKTALKQIARRGLGRSTIRVLSSVVPFVGQILVAVDLALTVKAGIYIVTAVYTFIDSFSYEYEIIIIVKNATEAVERRISDKVIYAKQISVKYYNEKTLAVEKNLKPVMGSLDTLLNMIEEQKKTLYECIDNKSKIPNVQHIRYKGNNHPQLSILGMRGFIREVVNHKCQEMPSK